MPRSDAPDAASQGGSATSRATQPSPALDGWFGVAMIAVGLLFISQAVGIERTGVTLDGDPGAKVFPLLLAALLLAGGVGYSARSAYAVFIAGRDRALDEDPAADRLSYRASRTPWLLVGGLLVSLVLVPYTGFSLTMLAFCAASLIVLGGRWYVAIAAGAVLIALVKVLFTRMFEVQLPEGVLELLL